MTKNVKKILAIIVSIIVLTVLGGAIGFYVYSSDYYRADEEAKSLFQEKNITIDDGIITVASDKTDIGIIFYPGAKVEYTAYLPLLEAICQKGYTCFLPKMPLNFAVLDSNVADDIIKNHNEIKTWYMAGHSLGGAMASKYTSENLDKIQGVILLGAYIYKNVPDEKAIVIYGSDDMVLDKTKLNGTENEIEIEGGNHAMFGNYGEQKGDGKAKISSQEQQEITVNLIDEFIKQTNTQ